MSSDVIEKGKRSKIWGNIWFGFDFFNGTSKFDGRRWTTYTSKDGIIDYPVYSIAVDKQGKVWFGTYGGVSLFTGKSWSVLKY